MKGALLVAGTSSDAGKSVIVAGLCRWLARRGVRVAPFKAQNMSLNSAVTADGAEIGRAQAMQAAAAGIEPDARMNPVLLKPGSDRRSQIVLLGRPVAEVDAVRYRGYAGRLLGAALDSLASLRREFDVVVCEGAGSPAEINLRRTDIANMGLARAARLPVILVGDIDRGGVFAAVYGTLALLEPADQALVAGFVLNKFRGAAELLEPGIERLADLTGRRPLGVVPWREDLWLDAEDSLALDAPRAAASPPYGREVLRVAVARLPRISNFTDIDALASEPGVLVRFTGRPAELADADLVLLPGSRATVADLAWLRDRGLAAVIAQRARQGRPVLGVCAGYQMLATEIDDQVESRAGLVPGLGLLPVRVTFEREKTLATPNGTAGAAPVAGYEIHHGTVTPQEPALANAAANQRLAAFPGGCRDGTVYGTSWHGVLENDDFRRAFLAEVAAASGRDFVPAPDTDFGRIRERRLDVLADLVAGHLDTGAVCSLIESGPPAGLPVLGPMALPPGARVAGAPADRRLPSPAAAVPAVNARTAARTVGLMQTRTDTPRAAGRGSRAPGRRDPGGRVRRAP